MTIVEKCFHPPWISLKLLISNLPFLQALNISKLTAKKFYIQCYSHHLRGNSSLFDTPSIPHNWYSLAAYKQVFFHLISGEPSHHQLPKRQNQIVPIDLTVKLPDIQFEPCGYNQKCWSIFWGIMKNFPAAGGLTLLPCLSVLYQQ